MEPSWGKSGIKNIHYRERDGLYVVKKWIGEKCVSFGTFGVLSDAIKIAEKLDKLDESDALQVKQLQIYGRRAGYVSRERSAQKRYKQSEKEKETAEKVRVIENAPTAEITANTLTFDAVLSLIEGNCTKLEKWRANRALGVLIKICRKAKRRGG